MRLTVKLAPVFEKHEGFYSARCNVIGHDILTTGTTKTEARAKLRIVAKHAIEAKCGSLK